MLGAASTGSSPTYVRRIQRTLFDDLTRSVLLQFMLQGGDFTRGNGENLFDATYVVLHIGPHLLPLGTGGKSIYGEKFQGMLPLLDLSGCCPCANSVSHRLLRR